MARRSIRRRVQAWYALVLLGVVAGYAALLYQEVRRARLQEVESDLVAAANYLDSSLRLWPRFELDGEPTPKKPGPKPPSKERLMTDLTPPGWSGSGDRWYGVWREGGEPIKVVGATPRFDPGLRGEVVMAAVPESREGRRRGPRGTWIVVGRSTAKVAADLEAFAWRLALTGAAVLLVGLAGGWWASSRIARPIAAIAETASRISARNLSERINADAVESELAGLAEVLNATFGRLDAAFGQLARFTADASHELRTPLAVLRSEAELALSRPRSADEYRRTVEACLRAASRLAKLVEGLLTLARVDAGQLGLCSSPIEFDAVVRDAAEQARPLAEAKGVTVRLSLEAVALSGDAVTLTRVVSNLLENAIRHSPEGGEVRVGLVIEGQARLTVADDGGGIPEADRQHVFERFYRVDKARSRADGGHGLGLAICKAIVEAHRGTVALESPPEGGAVFVVRLPLLLAPLSPCTQGERGRG